MSHSPAQYKKPSANNGAKVEAHLGRLQQSHCLAIHCFENEDTYNFYPTTTLSHLEKNEKQPLPDLLRNGNPALLSMSLLPRAGHSIAPFDSGMKRAAYLFDLSADRKKEPPLVVKCLNNWSRPGKFDGQIVTGQDNFHKTLYFNLKTGIPALDLLYGVGESAFKKAVAKHPTLSQTQLDAFGKYHEAVTHASVIEAPWNELLAAVTREHIAAIAVTYRAEAVEPWRKQAEILRGALAGLEHLKHGMDLPVVLYNVDGPDLGKCTYLAQGKEACTKVAIDAIRELQKVHNSKNFNVWIWHSHDLGEGCETLLGIDIYKPVDEQLHERGRG